MIVMYITYKSHDKIETRRFKKINKDFHAAIQEIELNRSIIESVKMFESIISPMHYDTLANAAQKTLINTTNPIFAARKARSLLLA